MKIQSNRRAITKSQSRRSGYVLIVTLLIIAMVGILTVGLARHSMNMAVASLKSEEDLQLKWGTASCQRFALQNHSRLLQEEVVNSSGKTEFKLLRRAECEFALGGQRFQVRLDDESAKLSLNHLLEYGNKAQAVSVVRRLAELSGIKIDLKPLANSKSRGPTEQPFECWGQVFVPDQEVRLDPFAIRSATTDLTCWSKMLNYQTSSPDVLFEFAKVLVGGSVARKLTNLRDKGELTNLDVSLDQIGATERHKRDLAAHLTNRSVTQSVWIEATTPTKQTHTLTIQESVTTSLTRIYSFSW